MKLYYKVLHLFFTKEANHTHCFDIGIYDSKEKAKRAIKLLKTKEGFCLRPDKFYIYRVLRFRKQKLLNQTYWIDGFNTYSHKK